LLDPLVYYCPEARLFPDLEERFARTGQLTGEELYLVLDWKSPRARAKHVHRLAQGRSFAEAAIMIGNHLYVAASDNDRLRILMTVWRFPLPTAAAILTVLYPNIFTMYDVRVCDALGHFHELAHRRWSSRTWSDYEMFVSAVKRAAPADLSLRDADRWLWGADKQKTMARDLEGR
jgi:hypothetical protein